MADLARAPAAPEEAAQAARILRAKTPLAKDDWERLDDEGRQRAITVAGELDIDVIRSMRDALARAKRDGIPYKEFVKTAGKEVGRGWGVDSPQLRTVFTNNIQSAVNAARYAAQNKPAVRAARPYWTLVVVDDETTSSTCGYFLTHPVVLPAGHPWWSSNYPPRHHRCRSLVEAITTAEAKKIGITSKLPDWPADKGWGKPAPLGDYRATLSDTISMPFPNEHAARQKEPNGYVRFRRGKPSGFPVGIFVIYGVRKDGALEVQSIRAKRAHWSADEFRAWLKKGGFKTQIEEAAATRTTMADPKPKSPEADPEEVFGQYAWPIALQSKDLRMGTVIDAASEAFDRYVDEGQHTVHAAGSSAKYSHIDFKPPKGAREEARRGLEWRREYGRGGTAVGVARARDLANGVALSPSTVRRMKAFFDRHQNGAGKGSKPGEQGFPSPWRIAWALWGGDAGHAWARKVVAQMNAADEKTNSMNDRRVKADLGPADVHIDGPIAPAKVRRKSVKKAKVQSDGPMPRATRRGFAVRYRNGSHTLEIRHMADTSDAVLMRGDVALFPGLALDAKGTLEGLDAKFYDAGANGEVVPVAQWSPPKWNQLAKCGAFRGHPAGPFELTPAIFEEIARNFRETQNKRIPIDFEHASEQDPTSGDIPAKGAPAQGWILDIENRGRDGLWGLTTFHPIAAKYIRDEQYRYFSPAIRFGAKDRVTGQPIGARMTSGALTNNPFLDGMAPMTASDKDAKTKDDAPSLMSMGEYCYSAAEFMPRLRMGLFAAGSPHVDMATGAECMAQLKRLEETYEQCLSAGADPMGDYMGVPLGMKLRQFRDALQMGMGMMWPDLFAVVKEMIRAAIGEHEEEMHPDAEDDEDESADSAGMRHDMSDKQDQEKIVALTGEKAALEVRLRDSEAKATAFESKVAALELQLNDKTAKLSALETDVKALRDEAEKRKAADETAAVELAYATYKDSRKLTEANKRQMLLTLRSDPALFAELYPPVAADQRHLQRTLSERQTTAMQGNVVGNQSAQRMVRLSDINARQKQLVAQGLSLEDATMQAYNEAGRNQGTVSHT